MDDVHRFASAKQVRGYLGLVPREWSSGETTMRGRLTKVGNRRLRSLLVEAAWGMFRRPHYKTQPLRAWALSIADRRGKRIAVTALARKLAGVLYALWRDQTEFESRSTKEVAAAAA